MLRILDSHFVVLLLVVGITVDGVDVRGCVYCILMRVDVEVLEALLCVASKCPLG